ncbi:MAG TPA: endonuclease/exonuclease/phosphatase family protein [Herpetosiphonaceae bacterium]
MPQPRARFRLRLLPFIAIYALAVAAVSLAWLTPLRAAPAMQLVSVAGPWIYVPLPVLALLALVRRQRANLLLLAGIALLFLISYGGRFWPKAAPAFVASAPALRVMSWNVLYDNDDVAAVSAQILAEQPDLVLLQEFGVGLSDGLAAALKAEYPHQALYPHPKPDGFAVFSRLPFAELHAPLLPGDSCRCQAIALEVGGRRVTVLNAHPYPPNTHLRSGIPAGITTESQDASLAALTAAAEREAGPLLLAGDFNLVDRQPGYGLLRAKLGDAFAEAGSGFGFTYPAQAKLNILPVGPVIRIDYIFHSAHWAAGAAWTGGTEVSDHRYVVADLLLR